MTEAEKKRKWYINGVRRRLNLPKDVKERVMSDFASSLSARDEAGQSDAEIYAELGSPKKAAADLNAQMKEYAYRKSPGLPRRCAPRNDSGGHTLVQETILYAKNFKYD